MTANGDDSQRPLSTHEIGPEMSIPTVVRRNTLLLAASQILYTIVAQINVLLGAFIILGLTGDVRLAGLGTAIAWGGRVIVVYQSGKLMDRLGRTRVIQLGTLLSIAGAIIIAAGLFALSLALTVSGLVVYGLGVGATNQNRVAVADMYPSYRRGEGLGYLLTASVVGALGATPFVLGGTWLAESLGFQSFSLAYAAILWLTTIILLAAAMVLTALVRPDPKKIADNLSSYYPSREARPEDQRDNRAAPIQIASYSVLATFAVSGLTQGNMTMNMALVPEVLHFHGAAVIMVSLAITIHIIGMYSLSTPLGRWADRFGRRRILMLGAVVSGTGALITPLSTDFRIITVGIFLVGLGWSAATIGSTALLSDMTAASERGRVIGLNDVVLGASALVFPVAGGIVLGTSRNFLALSLFGFLASLPALAIAFFLKEGEHYGSDS